MNRIKPFANWVKGKVVLTRSGTLFKIVGPGRYQASSNQGLWSFPVRSMLEHTNTWMLPIVGDKIIELESAKRLLAWRARVQEACVDAARGAAHTINEACAIGVEAEALVGVIRSSLKYNEAMMNIEEALAAGKEAV